MDGSAKGIGMDQIEPLDWEKLKASSLHRQLGHKLAVAFISHQLGVSFKTAEGYAKDESVGDAWLLVADFALQVTGRA